MWHTVFDQSQLLFRGDEDVMGLISRCSWDSRKGQEETKERKNWKMKGFPYGKRMLISLSQLSFHQQAQCKFMLSSFDEAYVCVWCT